jgi:HlyD family secretion protein
VTRIGAERHPAGDVDGSPFRDASDASDASRSSLDPAAKPRILRPGTHLMAVRARGIAALVVVLAVVAGGAYGIVRWRRAHAKPAVEFETAKVERGRIVSRVTATGTLSALVTVQVGSQVSGRIQKLFVDFNSPVKAGQVIAVIDPQLFQAASDQARANYVAAEGSLVKADAQARDAKRQFDRARGLLDRKLIAQADFDTAEANLDVANAQVAMAKGSLAQAKAGLHQAQVNLDYTRIVSPTDGVVISRSVDVGQTVAASLAAPTLFVIAQDLRKMQVDTSVTEADIGKLRPDMAATFTVDAFPGEKFRGKVRQIRNSATTVQNVVTYDAVIDVDNDQLKLRPGMTANVTFIWAEKSDALRVPNAALRFRPTAEMFTALALPVPPGLRDGPGGGARGPRAESGGAPAPSGAGAPTAASPGSGPGSGPAGTGAAGRTRGAGGAGRGEATSDRRTVWRERAGHPESVEVRTGISDGSMTEIVEGDLHESELVIVDASTSGQAAAAGSSGPPGGMRRIF